MNARQQREYADRVEQVRAFDHQVAVQNGTLEPTGDKIARECRSFAVMSLLMFIFNSLKG